MRKVIMHAHQPKDKKPFKSGLTIGKFYPPHAGHSYLIDTALRNTEEVTVVVCHRDDQRIPGTLRAQWLREMHPDARVVVVDDIMKDGDSRAWAEHTKEFLGFIPDVVFTSEEYGERYARFLGARHVLVDISRNAVPISATRIRANPLAEWEFLGGGARAYFAKRICVLGAESTGTTTMAQALAEHYNTVWVPEFGRMYAEAKTRARVQPPWRTEDFIYIANEQNRMEDQLARASNKIVIADTDSFATSIWHERCMGFISPEVDSISSGRSYNLYFLTDVDIPFVQDGTRDGESIRAAMHDRFKEELEKRGKPHVLLSGSHEARLRRAVQECDRVLRDVRPL